MNTVGHFMDNELEQCVEAAEHAARETGWDLQGFQDKAGWGRVGFALSRSRDAEVLEESNFEVALKLLREIDPAHVDTVTFGHWGFGWVETIVFDADHPVMAAEVLSLAHCLREYAALDDSDVSEREYEGVLEHLRQWTRTPAGLEKDVFSYLFDTYSVCRTEDLEEGQVKDALTHVHHEYEAYASDEDKCHVCKQPQGHQVHSEERP